LRRLVNRPEGVANISSPAVFRTIQNRKPTLLVDETDKVLARNHLLCGILNASYSRELAYVVRVVPRSKKHHANGHNPGPEYLPLDDTHPAASASPDSDPSTSHQPPTGSSPDDDVARFSCWCPKAMAQIGHFPETLADRCIIITMQRKTTAEKCERIRSLKSAESAHLRRQCADFVRQHRDHIANAQPLIPDGLNHRAADIWEPLFVLADLAGGHWPEKARQAAFALSGAETSTSLVSSLLLDCFFLFSQLDTDRLFTRDLLLHLNALPARAWRELAKGKPIDELWLAKQLRPFGIQPSTIWINDQAARGYLLEAFLEPTRRYTSKADWASWKAAAVKPNPPSPTPPATSTESGPPPSNDCGFDPGL
jgi:hypothetical protein